MGSERLERFPGLGYKTADVLVCLRTRSVMSWRKQDSAITCFWMASSFPPAATRTSRERADLPSSRRTQKCRRALLARVARICHIVSSWNRALNLQRAVSAFFWSASRILTSLLNRLAHSLSYSWRPSSHMTEHSDGVGHFTVSSRKELCFVAVPPSGWRSP